MTTCDQIGPSRAGDPRTLGLLRLEPRRVATLSGLPERKGA